MQTLNLTYIKWKQLRLSLTLQVYYIQSSGSSIDAVMVDLTNKFVYLTHITKSVDVSDFMSNIQPSSILQVSIDDCIASTVTH